MQHRNLSLDVTNDYLITPSYLEYCGQVGATEAMNHKKDVYVHGMSFISA